MTMRLSEDVKARRRGRRNKQASTHESADVRYLMSEEDLLKCVIDCAHRYGWRVAHFRTSQALRKDGSIRYLTAVQGDGKGFPDLVLVRNSLIYFVELKAEKGQMSPSQLEWEDSLGEWFRLWRPSDWLSGEIEKILSQ